MGSQCLLAGSAGYTHSSIMGENPEIWKAAAMADHFDKIQKLTEKIDGVPNFRRVPGYKVYCCGQPTIAGFEAAINKACGETYPKTNKIIWLNMRQEPIVYVNDNPICARPPNKIGEYAELGNVTRDSVKKDEEEFMRVVEGRAKGNDGKLKYVDVNKAEHEVEVKELTTLSLVIEGLKEKFPGLVHQRIPSATLLPPLRLTSTLFARLWRAPPSTAPSLSTARSVSPDPPPAAWPPASSESSSWPPPTRDSSRPSPVSTWTSSRWTGTAWTCPRIPSSEVGLR